MKILGVLFALLLITFWAAAYAALFYRLFIFFAGIR